METIFSPSEKERLERVWAVFLSDLESLHGRESITVGLSGGTSLLGFYGKLRDSFLKIPLDVRKKIRFVFIDERLVAKTDPDRTELALAKILFDPLAADGHLEKSQVLSVDEASEDPAGSYSRSVPSIDIALFGSGPDGHVASLFPRHPGLADASDRYIRVRNAPKPPPERISVSVPFLRTIPHAYLFFIGESKKSAYSNFLDPKIPERDCPAKYLIGCENLTVVTDIAG